VKRPSKLGAAALAIGLVAAACGGDDDDDSSASGGAEAAPVESCDTEIDAAIDDELGVGAAAMQRILNCAAEQPLEAEGEPIRIGYLNHEGDPAGSFPENSAGVRAAVEFINNELGGVGGDPVEGTAGRPIELVSCFSTISPSEATSCANEVAAEDPFAVFAGLNFFGQPVYDVFNGADIPVFVGSAISIADFTSPDVTTIGPGGGCLGVNVGEVDFAVNELEARNVMVVWADTPPGVVCFNDTQKKTLEVLSGELAPTPEGVETVDDLEFDDVNFPPGTADLTSVATQALENDPDAILMTVSGSDCWNFINALYAVGYNPDSGPALVFNDACNDPERIEQAGEQARGVYFVGPTNFSAAELYDGLLRQEVDLYEANLDEYEGEDAPRAGLGYVGFTSTMTLWQLMTEYATEVGLDAMVPQDFYDTVRATENHHAFGGFPLGCAEAAEPYVALCNTDVQVDQWTGDGHELQTDPFSAVNLIAGTELDSAATSG
jgi:branched-chain amino acid transport system substrate-binding protein